MDTRAWTYFYEGVNMDNNKELTKQEKYSMDIKDIAKQVKQQLKKEFPSCVFSVTIERYSMGQSLHVSLMKSSFKVIRDFKDISEMVLFKYTNSGRYTRDQIEKMQLENYHQLNHHLFYEKFDPDSWNNGVFLTEQGHNLFKRVCQMVNHYNYNDSDIQTDYFDVNFYFHLNIGQWNKPYILEEEQSRGVILKTLALFFLFFSDNIFSRIYLLDTSSNLSRTMRKS